MLGRRTIASLSLFHEPKLIDEGFAGTEGFHREGLGVLRGCRRGDVGFVGRLVFYLYRMGCEGFGWNVKGLDGM